ncbi:MAG: ArnT family glycosyltransferase, partial [Phycisphaerae bacterium]
MTDLAPDLERRSRTPAAGGLSLAVVIPTAMATLPLLVLGQLIAHLRVDEFDAWLFAHFGREMARGGVLYTQLWDNKPPGIFWTNALAFWASGGTMTGIIVVCALAVLAGSVVFFLLTRRLYGDTVAGLSTILAGLILNQQYFHVGCNRPSTFFVLTELLAMLFYIRALAASASRVGPLLICGFVAGVGLWFKQTAVAALGAMVLHQVLLRVGSKQSTGQSLKVVALIGAGFAGAIGLALAVILAASDAGAAWHAIVTFNRLYFQPGAGSHWLPEWFGL